MASVALYRKYRSQDFANVVGQTEIIATLTNAVKSGRVSHAYLFTGPRGVGKTSVARLLARAVNCIGTKDKPCNECTICQIDINSNLDLIEIDAASNRRIDEIRDLRDKINLAPAQSKYKVYIIDEVHMLTNEAFNALLKTLEEPPEHAIFILATTEVHKLPATIISRTQHFSFKPITASDVAARLLQIAAAEKIAIEPDAANLLAESAAGSLRDAISLLDQVASYDSSSLGVKDVRKLLGWSEQESIVDLVEAIAGGQTAAALQQIDQLQSQGIQAGQIIAQLTTFLRELMLAAAQAQPVSDAKQQASSKQLSLQYLTTAIDVFMGAAKATLPSLALETSTVRLSLLAQDHPGVSQSAAKPEPQSKAVAPATPAVPTSPATKAKPTAAAAGKDELWEKALALIKDYNNSLYALIRSCKEELTGDTLTLTCRFNFHRQRLEEAKNRTVIERAMKAAYGRPIKVEIDQDSSLNEKPTATSGELVSAAMEILGGEIVDE